MKALKSFLKKYCGVKREISGNIFVGGKVTRYFVLSLPFASRVQLATQLKSFAFMGDSTNGCIVDSASFLANALANPTRTAIKSCTKAPVKASMGGGGSRA